MEYGICLKARDISLRELNCICQVLSSPVTAGLMEEHGACLEIRVSRLSCDEMSTEPICAKTQVCLPAVLTADEKCGEFCSLFLRTS